MEEVFTSTEISHCYQPMAVILGMRFGLSSIRILQLFPPETCDGRGCRACVSGGFGRGGGIGDGGGGV